MGHTVLLQKLQKEEVHFFSWIPIISIKGGSMPHVLGSALVAVRLFKESDADKPWQDVPEASFLPVFVSSDQYKDNINKRLTLMYFKYPSAVVKLRWNLRDTPEDGEWLVSPFFISDGAGNGV